MEEFNIPKSNFNLIENNSHQIQILKFSVKRDAFIGC